VRAQIFNADGSKSGGEFLVNTTAGQSYSSQTVASITGLADGGFVIAWTDPSGMGGDTSETDVRAQIFNADGSKSGGEFLVNTITEASQDQPTITVLADGRFVVAWTDFSKTGGDTNHEAVRGQVFNADGTKSGGEFLVNTKTAHAQYDPTITGLADGRFVVAWTDRSKTLGDTGQAVHAQVFNADGTKSGDEFLVNTKTGKSQWLPTITALPDGRFVVAWTDSGSTADVRGQIFDPRKEAIDLVGSDRDDQFVGTRFGDIINGGKGNDWLLGEKGKDQFVFGEVGKKNADKLVDFKPGKDLIGLDGDVFTGIGHKLGKGEFEIGKLADDGADRVIYDRVKGKLYWDGDGKGGDDKVLFAKVDPFLKLSDDDFFMV
jgi:hypothetical protein